MAPTTPTPTPTLTPALYCLLLQGLPAPAGGRGRHPLPEAGGDWLAAAALVPGQNLSTQQPQPREHNLVSSSGNICFPEREFSKAWKLMRLPSQ